MDDRVIRNDQYLSLKPWVWVEFESDELPGPFPFLGGVDPQVVASLQEVHQRLSGAIDIAISDVFAGRASISDAHLHARLENAYAEVVNSRPHLRRHIQCGRTEGGAFFWTFPLNPSNGAVVHYAGLRVCNSVNRSVIPFRLPAHLAPAVGRLLGRLNGTRTLAEIREDIGTITAAFGPDAAPYLDGLLELLRTHDCLSPASRDSTRAHWLATTQDRDMIHLGHAALMYRGQDNFLLFDPWLMPWYAEAPVPSPWPSLLPQPAAIFLTHDHDDHVDPRTLLAFSKETPVIVPSRKNRRAFYYDYRALLGELGFTNVIELAHGDSWTFEGGRVVSVPFYGECSCELAMPRNCYLVSDRGRNLLVHVDSGPTNRGESMLKDGVIDELVRRHGPIETIYAQPGQLLELRTFAAYACLSHPGRWLEVGENCCVSSDYLSQLAACAKARMLVTYANGGADWLPDHPVFVFSGRNQALREMVTAHWWPLEELAGKLASVGCRCHHSRALDIVRQGGEGTPEPLVLAAPQPMELYRLDRDVPALVANDGQGKQSSWPQGSHPVG